MAETQHVEWPVFEGLFVRALQPSSEFAEALRAAGLDLSKPEPKYPASVLDAALTIACRFVYPDLPPDQAQYELGLKSGEMFFETLVGKVIGAAMPLLGPDRVIASMPKRIKAGTDGNCTVEKLGERRWRLVLDGHGNPHFAAGNFAGSLRRCKIEPTVKIEEARPERTAFLITW